MRSVLPSVVLSLGLLSAIAACGAIDPAPVVQNLSGDKALGDNDDLSAEAEKEREAETARLAAEKVAQEIDTAINRSNVQLAQYDYDGASKTLLDVSTKLPTGSTSSGNNTAIDDSAQGTISALQAEIEGAKKSAVPYTETDLVPHLFFHSLVVDTGRAFDGDDRQQGYLDYMITHYEFERILPELHKNGYVLVTPDQFTKINDNGNISYRDLLLPPGKKPLVFSVDDVSYYEYMEGDGFATKYVLEDGRVRNEYVEADGTTVTGAYDVSTVVDDFVDEHPDFSYHGAKGILALTGYNGVFGYRTSKNEYPDNKDIEQDIAAATEIANALKSTGWVMASHSWGHVSVGTTKMDRLKWDTKMWKEEVEPILGQTPHFIYPFGADIASVEKYSGERYDLLKKYGFDYFYGVDSTTTTWMQKGDKYLRQARINIDGLQFIKERSGRRAVLGDFFDVEKVIDPAR